MKIALIKTSREEIKFVMVPALEAEQTVQQHLKDNKRMTGQDELLHAEDIKLHPDKTELLHVSAESIQALCEVMFTIGAVSR